MNKEYLKQLFPGLEEPLFEELLKHGTVREVKAGETLLRVGQTIRSTILLLEGVVKLYREDDEGKEFFIYHL
jgi:CRP/FNR family transcriptional regulator